MDEKITQEELTEIRDRAEKATEGPWSEYVIQFACVEEDADFIAHAREDIPKLLAEIERMDNLTTEYGESITEFCTELYGRHNMTAHVADELIEIMAKYERK